MANFTLKKGNLFDFSVPEGKTILIPHVVNSVGAWGAGFTIPLGTHFPKAKTEYKDDWHHFRLGETQFVHTKCDFRPGKFIIASMFAQRGLPGGHNPKPLRYGKLAMAMEAVANEILNYDEEQMVIIAPKFGCGLARGDWGVVSVLIQDIWGDAGIEVEVWEL